MFLFYVFSWLIEKYKNVTSKLFRFWPKFSRIFLFCVLVDYFKAKKDVYSIHSSEGNTSSSKEDETVRWSGEPIQAEEKQDS